MEGDIYTTTYSSSTINHFDSNGELVDSITLPSAAGVELKGLAFSEDGILYAVTAVSGGGSVSNIDVDSNYTPVAYGDSYIRGNLSYGKIAVAGNGDFYVAGGRDLTAFRAGESSGDVIFTGNQIYDVEILPSGNLLVLSAYYLREITLDRSFVREINRFTDARGVEYDPLLIRGS